MAKLSRVTMKRQSMRKSTTPQKATRGTQAKPSTRSQRAFSHPGSDNDDSQAFQTADEANQADHDEVNADLAARLQQSRSLKKRTVVFVSEVDESPSKRARMDTSKEAAPASKNVKSKTPSLNTKTIDNEDPEEDEPEDQQIQVIAGRRSTGGKAPGTLRPSTPQPVDDGELFDTPTPSPSKHQVASTPKGSAKRRQNAPRETANRSPYAPTARQNKEVVEITSSAETNADEPDPDYDDLWPEANDNAGLGEEYIPSMKHHRMELLEGDIAHRVKSIYRILPQCVDDIADFWRQMAEEDKAIYRTILARKLDLEKVWDLATGIINVEPSKISDPVSEFQRSLRDLGSKLEDVGRHGTWDNPEAILQDFYIVVYPSVTLLAFMGISILTPAYQKIRLGSADACLAIDCILDFVSTVIEVEEMISGKVANNIMRRAKRHDTQKRNSKVSADDEDEDEDDEQTRAEATKYDFVGHPQSIICQCLARIEENFLTERNRRKMTMAKIDQEAREARERQAEKKEVEQRREQEKRERQEWERMTDFERRAKRWRDEDAKFESRRQRTVDGGDTRRNVFDKRWRKMREERVDEVRQELWQRWTVALEGLGTSASAATCLELCSEDELAKACHLRADDVEQEVRWLVEAHEENCNRNGWNVFAWPWAATLLDEWSPPQRP